MQITIKREDLLRPIGLVASAINRRQLLPILSFTLIRHNDEIWSLTGTDLEIEIIATLIRAESGKGAVDMVIPAQKLLDICRALPPEADIRLSKQGEKVVVSAGKSRFILQTMPSSDYPSMSTFGTAGQRITISQRALKTALERTHFCMAQQDVRYYLNGMYLELKPRQLRAVATDGHRMAITDVQIDEIDGAMESQVIVPRKAVQELLRLLADTEEPAEIEFHVNHIRVMVPGVKFTSKLIDGKYPDYTKVIPNVQTKVIRLERDALREALVRVAILANEKSRGIRLSLGPERLGVSAYNPEHEEATEELEYDYRGEPLEIGFNVNYLIDAANAIDNPVVELALSDTNSSCVMHAPGDITTRYVIMPMRL